MRKLCSRQATPSGTTHGDVTSRTRCKMLTEEFVVRLSQLKLEYPVSLFGKIYHINPLQLLNDTILIILTLRDCIIFIEWMQVTIHGLVMSLAVVSVYMTVVSYIVNHYTDEYLPKDVCKRIQEIGLVMNTSLGNEKDFILTAIIGSFYYRDPHLHKRLFWRNNRFV